MVLRFPPEALSDSLLRVRETSPSLPSESGRETRSSVLLFSDQSFLCTVLVQVPGGARLQTAHRILVLGLHTQHEHGNARTQTLDLSEYVHAGSSRHINVQYQQVATASANGTENLVPGPGLDKLRSGERTSQDVPKTAAHDHMVIC